MKKITIPMAIGALALALAACGGSSANHHSATSSVLVDSNGMALYSPAGESATNVRCTGACASIWMPVRPGAAKLSGAATITRPDGTKQLAVAGKPLYTFAQDKPGSVSGNGATDAFGDRQFTWHAVQSGGATAASAPMPGGGYSSSSGGY